MSMVLVAWMWTMRLKGRSLAKRSRKTRTPSAPRAYTIEEVRAIQERFKKRVLDRINDPVEFKRLLTEQRSMPKTLGGSKWFLGRRGRLSRGQIRSPGLAKIVDAALASGDPADRTTCTKALVYATHRDPLGRPDSDEYEDWDRTEETLEVVQQVGRGRTYVADAAGKVVEYPVVAVTAAVGSWLVDRGRLPAELLPRLTRVRLTKKKDDPEPRTKELPGP